jgi:hypothetical protein
MEFASFIAQVARELGEPILLRPQRHDLSRFPPVLQEFYSVADGVELPFVELYRVKRIREDDGSDVWGPGWIDFGFDGYSGHYLAATDPKQDPPIAFFDLDDTGIAEPVYGSVFELLAESYDAYTDDAHTTASIRVTSIPPTVGFAPVVIALKAASPEQTSRALLQKLSELPMTLTGVNAATAIRIVRQLHAKGVEAHLRDLGALD